MPTPPQVIGRRRTCRTRSSGDTEPHEIPSGVPCFPRRLGPFPSPQSAAAAILAVDAFRNETSAPCVRSLTTCWCARTSTSSAGWAHAPVNSSFPQRRRTIDVLFFLISTFFLSIGFSPECPVDASDRLRRPVRPSNGDRAQRYLSASPGTSAFVTASPARWLCRSWPMVVRSSWPT